MKTLYQAFFNAERFWRSDRLSQLPAFTDVQADNIVEAMGEMQFVFTQHQDDVVLTSYAMNETHLAYLNHLGYVFHPVHCLPGRSGQIEDLAQLQAVMPEVKTCSPYAILPSTPELCDSLKITADLPDIETVKRVNSKSYSTTLAREVSAGYNGRIVGSAQELLLAGELLLSSSAMLIKDTFGVSGKGNILVNNNHALHSICRYLEKQEAKGKTTELILEPLLAKELDFSCHLHIHRQGGCRIFSVQVMDNKGFSFSGIQTADQGLCSKLTASGYFEIVERVASALFREGYFGPVCVDSMLLTDGTVVPIVEINARKSMGLINYRLNSFLERYRVSGRLSTFSFTTDQPVMFTAFFHHLQEAGLLFEPGKTSGLLPLSANTFDINHQLASVLHQPGRRGRLYASVIAGDPDEADTIRKGVNTAFEIHQLKTL